MKVTFCRSLIVALLLSSLRPAGSRADPPQDDRRRIYALFVCQSYSNTCRLSAEGPLQGGLFRSEKECKEFLARGAQAFPPGSKTWFECRSKAVDDWQR